jgi:hypothetical protein
VTPDQIAARVDAERAAQELPELLEDPQVIAQVVALIAPRLDEPSRGKEDGNPNR